MELRTLTDHDYELFLPLIQDFRETKFTRDMFSKQLKAIQAFGDIWVVEHEGKLIATGTILYEPKFIFNLSTLAHIEDVCVKVEYRRKGIGKLVVTHLMNEAKRNKCYKVTLDCADNNVTFYEACGLERRGNQLCQLTENITST